MACPAACELAGALERWAERSFAKLLANQRRTQAHIVDFPFALIAKDPRSRPFLADLQIETAAVAMPPRQAQLGKSKRRQSGI
jgi:hypothetical protein